MKRALYAFTLTVALLPPPRLAEAENAQVEALPPDSISDIIPIKHVPAAEFAALFNASSAQYFDRSGIIMETHCFQSEVEGLGPKQIIGDELNNSLLVIASPPDLARIKEIIARLDGLTPRIRLETVVFQLPLKDPKIFERSRTQPDGPADLCRRLNSLTQFDLRYVASFVPVDTTNALAPRNGEFHYSATSKSDLIGVVQSSTTRSGIKIVQHDGRQTDEGCLQIMYLLNGGKPALPSQVTIPHVGDTFLMLPFACFLGKDHSLLMDFQQDAYRTTGLITNSDWGLDMPVMTVSRSQSHIAIHHGETIVLGGLVETAESPRFSRIRRLDQLPWLGNFINGLITYPRRKSSYELVVLIKPEVLPALSETPEAHGPAAPGL